MANSLESSFDFVLDKVELWLAAFRNSARVAERLFTEHSTTRTRVRAVTSLWFGSFFLSIVITSPVYYRYGLTPEIHLTSVLAQYCGLFALAWCFHRALRTYGVRSRLPETFVLWATVAAGLAPLFTLATLPGKLRILELAHAANTAHVKFWPALYQVFHQQPQRDSMIELVDVYALPVVMGLIAFGTARLVPIVTRHYAADSWRVIRAMAYASAVLTPLPIIATVIVEVVLYYVLIIEVK